MRQQKLHHNKFDQMIYIRKIGVGGFSQVFLVQDKNTNKQYALKKILKKPFQNNLNYLYREISIMQQLSASQSLSNSAKSIKKNKSNILKPESVGQINITKLHSWQQTNHHLNLLLEYCDGGDLRRDMELYGPTKVYPLQTAKIIIVDVIRGLEIVHNKGYVHRDIKIQNIFVKNRKDSQNNIIDKMYKIGDFGISKKFQVELAKTVLGTKLYMSPEIYKEVQYGFEVDMWALGVLFCFMLNRSYPFRLNPFQDNMQNIILSLNNQAKAFSYKKYVQRSKHKIIQNCTNQLQDLFDKFFKVDPHQRLTFLQIRKHPVFYEHFKNYQISKEVQKTYLKQSPKTQTLLQMPSSAILQNNSFKGQSSEILGKFVIEKRILKHQNSKIQFFYQNFMDIKKIKGLSLIDKAPLCYNLLKYYLSLKQSFLIKIVTPEFYKNQPKIKMQSFKNTEQFGYLVYKFKQQLKTAAIKFEDLHDQCRDYLNQISKHNQSFAQSFLNKQSSFSDTKFEGVFKKSYRISTYIVYKRSGQLCKQFPKNHEFFYLRVLTAICHVFNRLLLQKQNFYDTFHQFFEETNSNKQYFNFNKLRNWLQCASIQTLYTIAAKIIQIFMK